MSDREIRRAQREAAHMATPEALQRLIAESSRAGRALGGGPSDLTTHAASRSLLPRIKALHGGVGSPKVRLEFQQMRKTEESYPCYFLRYRGVPYPIASAESQHVLVATQLFINEMDRLAATGESKGARCPRRVVRKHCLRSRCPCGKGAEIGLDHTQVITTEAGIAFISQPYGGRGREALIAWAKELGIEVEVTEPRGNRSWHNPGSTWLIVLTARE